MSDEDALKRFNSSKERELHLFTFNRKFKILNPFKSFVLVNFSLCNFAVMMLSIN